MTSNHCSNCGFQLHGKYCSNCGQKAEAQLALRPFLQDLFSKTSEFDFKLVRTLKDLVIRPGAMIRNYLDGKRIPYTNPFKALFIVTALYILVVSYFKISIDFYNQNENAGNAVLIFMNYLIFIFLAATALIFHLTFKKYNVNWVKSYIILCYCWTGYLIFTIALAIISLWFPIKFELTRLLIPLFYLPFVFIRLFDDSWWAILWRTLVVYIAYFVVTAIIMMAIIHLAHFFHFKPLMLTMGASQ